MALPLFNSIASFILKKRIHQIELFVKYPHEVQQELLANLLQTARGTEYGKQFGFDQIRHYEHFRNEVPLVEYNDLQDRIERMRQGEPNIFWPGQIKWFAKSSGTTNAKSKFIPLSRETLENCHYEASKDLLCLYLNNNPNSELFNGKSLRLGGSKELYQDRDTFFGDLSAILIDNMPIWAEFSSTPSNRVSLMGDWESKLPAIVQATMNENVTSLAGVPSWMLVLLNKILEAKGASDLSQIWPQAEVYFHGGVNFEPYRLQYQKLFPQENFNFYEIYNASEGFFAIQDQNDSNDLLLMLDYGIFYEFIPMDTFGTAHQKVIPLWEVELDKNYAMVITTNSGLWRYVIGDTVRFTGKFPYRIRVSGRTKQHINVFGEELMVENTDRAIALTCEAFGCEVTDYSVAPIFMDNQNSGAHEWMIEFRCPPQDIEAFRIELDKKLQQLNSDYEAKRFNNMTLKPLELHVARPNLFYDWLKEQDKLGGQHKIPRLSNDRTYLEQLLNMQATQNLA